MWKPSKNGYVQCDATDSQSTVSSRPIGLSVGLWNGYIGLYGILR